MSHLSDIRVHETITCCRFRVFSSKGVVGFKDVISQHSPRDSGELRLGCFKKEVLLDNLAGAEGRRMLERNGNAGPPSFRVITIGSIVCIQARQIVYLASGYAHP
jgi:hypothetical protein